MKSSKIGIALTIAVVLVVSGCTTQVPKSAQNSSGKPEPASLPGDLTAEAGPSEGEITLRWKPLAGEKINVTQYRIYRGNTSENLRSLKEVGGALSYIDPGLPKGSRWYYRVGGILGEKEAFLGKVVHQYAAVLPGPPRNVTTVPSSQIGQIIVSWDRPLQEGHPSVQFYHIYRKTATENETFLAAVEGNTTTYNDTLSVLSALGHCLDVKERHYRVRSVTKIGESEFSNQAVSKLMAPRPACSGPTYEVPPIPESTKAPPASTTAPPARLLLPPGATIDLIVSDIGSVPSSPNPGQTIRFSANITDTGNFPAGWFRLRFLANGSVLGNSEGILVKGLGSGSRMQVESDELTAADTTYSVTVDVDVFDQIPEINESNNNRTTNITVRWPDLVVTGVTWSPAWPIAGEIMVVTATVQNRGNTWHQRLGNQKSMDVGFYLNGVQLRRVPVEVPGAGAEKTVTAAWTAPGGSHSLQVIVDLLRQVPESDKSNNGFQSAYRITVT